MQTGDFRFAAIVPTRSGAMTVGGPFAWPIAPRLPRYLGSLSMFKLATRMELSPYMDGAQV